MNGILLYVCFSSKSIVFHLFEDVIISGEGLQILTYARHLWPLSSEGSLACYTYCYTEHPIILVISEDHWPPCVWCFIVTSSLNDLGLSWLGLEHSICRLRGEYSNPLRQRREREREEKRERERERGKV